MTILPKTILDQGGKVMTRPFCSFVAALMAGIVCGRFYRLPDLPVQVILVIALILIFWIRGCESVYRIRLLILFSVFMTGILNLNLHMNPHAGSDHIRRFVCSEKMTVEGVICENPQRSPERTVLVVSASRVIHNGQYIPCSGRILLNILGHHPLHYGDFIRFHTRLNSPHNFRNPGGFDYETYLHLQGILVRGFVKDTTGFVVLRRAGGNPLWLRLEQFRNRLRNAITEKAPGPEGKIIQAMILGDQKEIPIEIMDKFNRTGTTHIIAISGFNVGIVAFFSLLLARFGLRADYIILRWDIARISTFVAILVVILYTFVAGAGISVLRASIMVIVFLIAIVVNRERDLYNTLSLAAFLILIFSPGSLFDISFQLSFVAAASLIFFMPKWIALLPPLTIHRNNQLSKEWIRYQCLKAVKASMIFFLASLSATLGTIPLILFYFNRLSLVTLIANVLSVPILGILAIPVSMVIILAVPISSAISDCFITISEILVRVSLFVIDRLAAFPWSSIYLPTPTLFEIVGFYSFLIWGGLLMERYTAMSSFREAVKSSVLFIAFPIFLIIFITVDVIHDHVQHCQKGHLVLTAVDVGQGSSTLIRFPGGRTMLVDGGGFLDDTFDVGKTVLAPYLWHERIAKIDTVVLTHPHPDHLQGLLFIMENFHVREVWINGDASQTESYIAFCRIIDHKNMFLRTLSGDSREENIQGVRLKILNPQMNHDITGTYFSRSIGIHGVDRQSDLKPIPGKMTRSHNSDATNDRSMVIKISYGEKRFLLTADISSSVEDRLIHSEDNLESDVIFVPHHGSIHSSSVSFIQKVKPKIAIISCGVGNLFSNPHPEILSRYETVKANIYRTDRDGAISLVTDGHGITISAFSSGRSRTVSSFNHRFMD